MKNIAARRRGPVRALLAALVFTLGLGGCAVPERAAAPKLYDFGAVAGAATAAPAGERPALALRIVATPALEGQAMLYRLAYADEAQLRAYALARWSMPPADLLQQRLRESLGARYLVLGPGEGAGRVLRLELEEFSQRFETAERSVGQLRLRATWLQVTPVGERAMAQRSVAVQRPAASADAPGGVRALAAASEAAAQELTQWLETLR